MKAHVSPTRCEGFGSCSGVLPEVFSLDEWGYAFVEREDVPLDLQPAAREAQAACPVDAITLEED